MDDKVLALQKELKAQGYFKGKLDGVMGPITQAAVNKRRDALDKKKTQDTPAAPAAPVDKFKLSEADIQGAAKFLNVTPRHIKTVISVEASGVFLNSLGKPLIRLEPHKFNEFTKGAYMFKYPLLASPSFQQNSYGKTQDVVRERFADACALNRSAAIRATSWGAFQILGENYILCGFDNLDKFIEAQNSAQGQLGCFVNFVSRRGLRDALSRGSVTPESWEDFARGYNGKLFAKFNYHTKCATTFARVK
jgi:hypothetical protein